MASFLRSVWHYVVACYFHKWFGIVGGTIGVLATYEWFAGNTLSVPFWLKLAFGIAALIIAPFLAYRDLEQRLTAQQKAETLHVYVSVQQEGRPIWVRIMNGSPTGIAVQEVAFRLWRRDHDKETSGVKSVAFMIPSDQDRPVDMVNDFEWAVGRLHVPNEEGNIPLAGEVKVTYRGHGRRETTDAVRFQAVFTLSRQFSEFRPLS